MSRCGTLLAIGLLAAACTPRVDDLRLEGLRPPHIAMLERSPRLLPGFTAPVIVADLSTTRDLRFLESRLSSGSSVDVTLCRGRTRITRQEAFSDVVSAGHWREEPGTNVTTRPMMERSPPPGGRFNYSVAIALRQTARTHVAEGLSDLSFAELDLMRNPVDLCLVIDSVNFGPRWRSNTVVIPAEAIRAAVAAAAAPR